MDEVSKSELTIERDGELSLEIEINFFSRQLSLCLLLPFHFLCYRRKSILRHLALVRMKQVGPTSAYHRSLDPTLFAKARRVFGFFRPLTASYFPNSPRTNMLHPSPPSSASSDQHNHEYSSNGNLLCFHLLSTSIFHISPSHRGRIATFWTEGPVPPTRRKLDELPPRMPAFQ